MKSWNGSGAHQWEHTRRWEMGVGASEFVRAEGALSLTGGFSSLSFFVRRQSQTSGSKFELALWTAPIYFRNMDDSIDNTNANQFLLPLPLEPSAGLVMTTTGNIGTGPYIFGAKFKSDNPMGTLLFWQMKNSDTESVAGSIVADLYVVANHGGVLSFPSITKTMEVGCEGGQVERSAWSNAGVYGRR